MSTGNTQKPKQEFVIQKSNMGLQSFNFLATTIIANQQSQQTSSQSTTQQQSTKTKTEKK